MGQTYNKGLVPLSADPITRGHLDIITRACAQCRELIVLIGHNDLKCGSYLFSLPERIDMIGRAVAHLDNVRVQACQSLLVDIFSREGCDAVFRGIRNEADRTYETQQMRYNDLILPGFSSHVVYLTSAPEFVDVSSSAVKAFVSHHVDVSRFVPIFVKARLEEEICGYQLVGITGGMASGKSYVAGELVKRLGGTHLNFDELLHDLYVEDSTGAQQVRDQLADWFGETVLSKDRKAVDCEVLKTKLFAPDCSTQHREEASRLTEQHVLRLYRDRLGKAKGVVVVEWAQFAEMNLSHLVSHRVIVVDSPDRDELVRKRGIDAEPFARVEIHQWSVERKVASLEAAVKQDDFGSIVVYENHTDPERSKRGLDRLADHVRTMLDLKKR